MGCNKDGGRFITKMTHISIYAQSWFPVPTLYFSVYPCALLKLSTAPKELEHLIQTRFGMILSFTLRLLEYISGMVELLLEMSPM